LEELAKDGEIGGHRSHVPIAQIRDVVWLQAGRHVRAKVCGHALAMRYTQAWNALA
jgi:hypothetical protein